jgi:hypothetical protein
MGGLFSGTTPLGQSITNGLQQQKMRSNPMPPGQQGPPSPGGNPLSMLPDMEYSGKDGLTIKLSQDHIQSLMGQMQQMQQQQAMKQRVAQMMQQQQAAQQQRGQMTPPQNVSQASMPQQPNAQGQPYVTGPS